MTGTTIDPNRHLQMDFSAYVEVHEDQKPKNSQKTRTEPAVCIGPMGNIQGSYWFLNLRTGQRIKRRKVTPLLDPSKIIARVHELADNDKQNPALDFYDWHWYPIEEENLTNPDDIVDEIAGVDEEADPNRFEGTGVE